MVNKKRLMNTFLDLAIIDSPSYSEREVAEKIISVLEPIGFKCILDDAGEKLNGSCGNLYAVLEGDDELEPLMFSAHMDTVQPCYFKHTVVDEDGTIHSDGKTIVGADDMSGVAEILEAVSIVYENRMNHRTIELLFTIAEELHCEGSKLFDFSKIKSKECYVLDYDGEIGSAATAAPAKVGFTAEIIGKAAHAGFAPELGANAIAAMAQAIANTKQGRVSQTRTLNIGNISGGTVTNIVPDSCKISGEIRDISTQEAIDAAEKIKVEFEEVAISFGAKLNYEYDLQYSAYNVADSHSVVKRYKEACERSGLKFKTETTFGGSDNNVYVDNDITGIVVACGMHNCHSVEEYTSLDEMAKVTEILVSLMTNE